MAGRRTTSNTAPLFVAAALSYTANCALGLAVAARVIDTRRLRWLHHALYITTCTAVAIALGTVFLRRSPANQRTALALVPAVVPLAAVAYVPTHSRRHPFVALAAAPFIVASVVCSLRPADRE
ncbi:hypothetical protein [Microbacterium sp.]|uniref:hypothetical protein n=1 Tax=Microbacterium sp. TaxID=51671 RepID=UPI002734323B|nr:hypothetical protein [Microbacterium sp.]MDP3951038.1 hypothetical protein [Microbacterium sp.]